MLGLTDRTAQGSPRWKLVRACREGDLDMVKQLCEDDYPFEEESEPNVPLHEACWYVFSNHMQAYIKYVYVYLSMSVPTIPRALLQSIVRFCWGFDSASNLGYWLLSGGEVGI